MPSCRSGRGGAGWWPKLFLFLPFALLPHPLWSGGLSFTVQGETVKNSCRSCHGWRVPVVERRVLGAPHGGLVVSHGKASLWCLECHMPQRPAQLRTLTGASVPFAETHESCAGCHGRTVSSWRKGVHGKRLARWSGERVIQSCTGCHAVHAPTVLPLVPKSPPRRPQRG